MGVRPFREEDINTRATDGSVETHDHICAPPKPDTAMFYGIVGEVARAAAKDTDVNPTAAAAAFLSFLGANVGRDVYLKIGNTWHHPRLFTLHIGRSGRGRKGDSVALVHRIRRRVEESYAGTVGLTHSGGLSSREGLALLIHDGFKDGKQDFPPIIDKRLWIIENEFANVLHQAARNGNTLSAALRDAWDGVSIKPATKTSRVWASHPHIGLHACITPGELLDLIRERELSNGFANRFLMVWAEKTGSVAFPRPSPTDVVNDLSDRIRPILAFAKGAYPAQYNTREIRLADEASILYAEAYRNELDVPHQSGLITSLLERQAPYVLRLAALLAITDKSFWIEPAHLKSALAWARYSRQSVEYIFSAIAESKSDRQAEQLAVKIMEFLKDKPNGASKANIYAQCFMNHESAQSIDNALMLLLSATPPSIEQVSTKRADGKPGRSAKVYRAISKDVSVISVNSLVRPAARDSSECVSSVISSDGDELPDLITQTTQTTQPPETRVDRQTKQIKQTTQDILRNQDTGLI